MTKPKQASFRGVIVVAVSLLIFAIILLGELFSVQIIQGDVYKKRAGNRHFTKRQTYPERGKIVDANGETLAMTTYVYTIGITPASVRSTLKSDAKHKNSDKIGPPSEEEIMTEFSKYLQVDYSKIKELFALKDKPYVVVKKNLTKEQYDPFEAYLNDNLINGVAVDALPRRFYPKNDVASQVIGFANLNEKTLIGVNGVEAFYDKILAGTPGYTYGEVDHYYGGQLPYTTPTETSSIPGNNIVLNIDSNLQAEVQKIVNRYSNLFTALDGGSAIVLDTKTGAVKAMAQDFSFDLNKPYAVLPGLSEGGRRLRKTFYDANGYELEAHEKDLQTQMEELIRLANERRENVKAQNGEDINKKSQNTVYGPKAPYEILKFLQSNYSTFKAIDEVKETDPNYRGWSPFTNKYDMDFLNYRIWTNKNVSLTYEPGSTMKAFTVANALEEHAFKLEEQFSDSPIWIKGFGDYAIHCHVFPDNHAYETAEQALGNSCNPVMVQLAERVGVEKFYNYINLLGFYDITGIDLPAEARGLLHTSPTVVDLAPMSFGESNTITPISLATAYTALGNDGVMIKPQVAKYLTDNQGKIVRDFAPQPIRQVYSKETSQIVLGMLRSAVTKGIVSYIAEPGYFVAGKTGTSTKKILNGDDDDYAVMSVASIFPVDEPRYVVVVALYGPNSDTTACCQSMCRDVIRATGRLLNVPKRYTETDLYKITVPKEISYANGITLQSIANYLAVKNIEFELQPGMKYTDFFYTMYPLGAQKLHGYPVFYVSKDGEPPTEQVEVPNFIGKTFEEAADLAYQRRINIKYEGNPLTGVIIEQSVPEKDENNKQQKIRKYEVIELKFGHLDGYNPPFINRVSEPVVGNSRNYLPVVTDPIWTTQRIYSPYGGVPEHNPYGG